MTLAATHREKFSSDFGRQLMTILWQHVQGYRGNVCARAAQKYMMEGKFVERYGTKVLGSSQNEVTTSDGHKV